MRDALMRALRRAGKRASTPAGFVPRQAGARMFWTLSGDQLEQESQLSAPRRFGVVGLIVLVFLAAPMVWASTAFVDTPLATIPSAKASDGEDDGEDDDEDGEDTDTDGEGETDGDTGRNDDTEDGEDDGTDNDGVATGAAALRGDTTDGAGDPGTVTTTSHNAAATTNTDTYTGPHLAGKADDTGTTTSGNDGTTRTATETAGGDTTR
jgi:hypothetical protein